MYRGKTKSIFQNGGLIDIGKFSPTQIREEDVIAPPAQKMANPPNQVQQGLQSGVIIPPKTDPNESHIAQMYASDPLMQYQYDNSLGEGVQQYGSPDDKRMYKKWYNQKYNKQSFNPENLGADLMMATAAASEISGIVARGRQNDYDMWQQQLLGYQNAMPSSQFQPSPYRPYAKHGGKQPEYFGPPFTRGRTFLRQFEEEDRYDKTAAKYIINKMLRNRYRKELGGPTGPPFSNDATMDMTNAGIMGNEKKTSKRPRPPKTDAKAPTQYIRQQGGSVYQQGPIYREPTQYSYDWEKGTLNRKMPTLDTIGEFRIPTNIPQINPTAAPLKDTPAAFVDQFLSPLVNDVYAKPPDPDANRTRGISRLHTIVNKKGGSIRIKPENRGKFTEYCGGKVTSACIAKGKASSDPAVRKRATFAANARKWK